MGLVDEYKVHLKNVRRYSSRTVEIYVSAVEDFVSWIGREGTEVNDVLLVDSLIPSLIREYVLSQLDSSVGKSAKTVNLHLSALSGFCQYLMKKGIMTSNPVRMVPKPKIEKPLPHFFRKDSVDTYFNNTNWMFQKDSFQSFLSSWETKSGKDYYTDLLARVIISCLYSLGIRRAELISLKVGDVDFGRKVVKVHGKGDKMREIPLIASLSEELLLYLKAVETMCGGKRSLTQPLLVTYAGKPLYPMYVDRTVKQELGDVKGISGRKSPHVLRHSLATELMNDGTNLNTIKEMLGHSSLASTQVYTHSSISRLKNIYERAHPRAKNGGKHGD